MQVNGWVLRDKTTGAEVNLNDEVTDFRGKKAKVCGDSPPRHSASTGHVVVNGDAEYYAGVFGLEWTRAGAG